MKTTLLTQIRQRRLALGHKIQEMPLRAGVTRQQYGKIEAGGNPRLSTLDQIAEGLDAVLVFVPKSKLKLVEQVLAGEIVGDQVSSRDEAAEDEEFPVVESPWDDI